MASRKKTSAQQKEEQESAGELLVAWQKYTAISPEELTLREGDVVELLDTEDPTVTTPKRIKLDPDLEVKGEKLLDSSAAKHKLSVKPKRSRHSSGYSPSRTPLNARWLVRQVKGEKRQGWVPCQVLQTLDDPQPGTGLPGDAAFRRQAVVKELVETEQEFVRDLDFVVQKYLIGSEKEPRKPKIIKDNFELIFGNLKEISEFHRTVLMEGVRYYANEPHLLGKAFLRLERDFDKHVNYCKEEPLAQTFLDTCDVAKEYFDELSNRLGDDKTISEHLKLPIQRINDYQLLLKELVRYSACLGEDNTDLQKALELMLSVPHRAQDDKFTNSIEGYRGSIHKLGRLLAHDWFSVCFGDITKERYLFLFKGRILISKVRRISEDRSVFQLKDIVKLPQVEIKDHPENQFEFELIDKVAGHSLVFTSHRENVKEFWLEEIREFATEAVDDDLQLISQPPSPPEPVAEQYRLPKEVPQIQIQEEVKPARPAPTPPKKLEEAKQVPPKEESKAVPKEEPKESPKEVQKALQKDEIKATPKVDAKATHKEEAKVSPKEEAKVNLKEEVKATLKEEVKSTPIEEAKSTPKEEAKATPKEEVKPAQAKAPSTEEVKATPKKEVQVQRKEEVKTSPKEEARTPVKEEVKVVVKEEVKVAPKEEVKHKLKVEEKVSAKEEPKEEQKVAPQKKEEAKPASQNKVEEIKVNPPTNPQPQTQQTVTATVTTQEVTTKKEVKVVEQRKTTTQQEEIIVHPTQRSHLDNPKLKSLSVHHQEHTIHSSVLARDGSSSDLLHDYGDSFRVNVEVNLGVDQEGMSKKHVTDYGTTESGGRGDYSMSTSSYGRRSASETASSMTSTSSTTRYSALQDSTSMSSRFSGGRSLSTDSGGKYGETTTTASFRTSSAFEGSDDIGLGSYKRSASLRSSYDDGDEIGGYKSRLSKRISYDEGGDDIGGYKRLSKKSSYDEGSDNISGYKSRSTKRSSYDEGEYSFRRSSDSVISPEDEEYSFGRQSMRDRKKLRDEDRGIDYSFSRKSIKTQKGVLDEDDDYSSSKRRAELLKISIDEEEPFSIKKYENNYKRMSSIDDDTDFTTSYSSKIRSKTLDEKGYSRMSSQDSDSGSYKRHKSRTSIDEEDDSYYGSKSSYKRTISLDNSKDTTDNYKSKVRSNTSSSLDRDSYKKSMHSSLDESIDPDAYISKIRSSRASESDVKYERSSSTIDPEVYKRSLSVQSEGEDRLAKFEKYSRRTSDGKSEYETESETSRNVEALIEKSKRRFREIEESLLEEEETKTKRNNYDIPELESYTSIKKEKIETPLVKEKSIDIERTKLIKDEAVISQKETIDEPKNEIKEVPKTKEETKKDDRPKSETEEVTPKKADKIKIEPEPESPQPEEATNKPEKLKKQPEPVSPQPEEAPKKPKIKPEKPENEATSKAKIEEEIPKPREETPKKSEKPQKQPEPESPQPEEAPKKPEKPKKQKEPESPQPEEAPKKPEKAKKQQEPESPQPEEAPKKPKIKSERTENEATSKAKKSKGKQGEEIDSFQSVTQKAVFDGNILEKVIEKSKSSSDMAPPEEVPKFTKTVGGTHIKPGERAMFEIQLAETPDSLTFLRNNRVIEGELALRCKVTSLDEHKTWKLEIIDCVDTDSGVFTAVACNSKGKSTCTSHLLVHKLTEEEQLELKKPDFLIKLKDTELIENTHLRFMMKIKGDPHPTMTFFKDGKKIVESDRIQINRDHSDHDFFELVIPEVSQSDAGLYKCVIKNDYGEATSEATVTVTESKNLFDDIVDKDTLLPKGEKPSFIWRKDGEEFEAEERFKVLMGDDEDSLALIFQHVKPEDAGLYTCVAQTSTGHISCSAELTVQGTVHELHREPEKPTLVIEKREAITSVGATCIMELQVKGFPKPKVNWSHGGKPIEASSKYKFLYEDDETQTLVIKNIEPADAGKYEIIAENELGQDIREMEVIVKQPPKISKMPDTTASTEQELKMTADIDGIPKPTVQFYKDGKVLKESDNIKFVTEGKKYSLVIKKTALKDTGNYSVVASNEEAQVSQFWNVEIYCKPKVLKKLGENVAVMQKSEVELTVKYESEPPPEVTWYKDDKEIKSDGHFTISNDGDTYRLKISGTVTTDSASYKVRAKNIHGTVDDEARVDVKRAPSVTKGLHDITVTENDVNVTLDLKLDAFPKPAVKWYLDEVEISESRKEYSRIEKDDGVQLVIKEVTTEMKGNYTCKLINELGETSTSGKLTVQCKPKVIKQLKDTTVEEGATLHLEVEVEAVPEPEVKWLRNGREVSADARIIITRDSSRLENYHLDVNLIKHDEDGEYEVQITNKLGTVNSKSRVTVQKLTQGDEKPPKLEVQQVEVEEDQSPKKLIVEEVKEEEKQTPEVEITAEKMDLEVCKIDSFWGEEEPYISKNVFKKGKLEYIDNVDKKDVSDRAGKKNNAKSSSDSEDSLKEEWSTSTSDAIKSRNSIAQGTLSAATLVSEEASFTVTKNSKDDTLEASFSAKNKRSQTTSDTHIDKLIIEKYESQENDTVEEECTDEESLLIKYKDAKATAEGTDSLTLKSYVEKKDTQDIDFWNEFAEEDNTKQDATRYERTHRRTKETLKITHQHEKITKVVEQTTTPRDTPQSAKLINEDKSNISIKKVETIVQHKEHLGEINIWPKTPTVAEIFGMEIHEFVAAPLYKLLNEEKDEQIPCKTKFVAQKIQENTQHTEATPVIDASCNATLAQTANLEDLTKLEALPKILDSNVNDKSEYESLDTTYTVKTGGHPAPAVAWSVDGKVIKPGSNLRYNVKDEGDSHTLQIVKLEPKDAGVFEVVVSNTVGEIKQQSKLEVIPEAELRRPKVPSGKGLQDQNVLKKKQAVLKAIIIGDPIPEITWLYNKKPISDETFEKYKMVIESDATAIENGLKESTFSLTIPRCERVNGGEYSIHAKNKWGEVDTSGILNIVLAPEIKGLDYVKVVPGDPIDLSCTIEANPKPIVTWTKSENVIEATSDIEIIEDLANEKYTLRFKTTNLSDEGYYQLYAKNEYGQDESEGRIKIIREPDPSTEKPVFITGLTDSSVVHCGEISMMVRADGLPKPELRWYLNDKLIQHAPELQFVDHSDRQLTSTLSITDFGEKDVGMYKVTAVNVVGDAETSAKIAMLLTPPSFIKKLERSHDLKEGDKLELKAKVNGSPKPTVAWYKDGELVSPDDKHIKTEFLPDGTVKLTIDKVTPDDCGAYKLLVKNATGETAGLCAVAVAATPRRPKFLKCIKDTKAVVGEPLKLTAQVCAYPTPESKWYKDGLSVRASSNIHLEHHPDGTIALVVDNVRPENAGKYELIVSNKMGEISGEAKVEIEKRPTRPDFIVKLLPQTVVEGYPAKFEVKVTGFPEPQIVWSRNGAEIVSDSKHVRVTDHPDGYSTLVIEATDEIRDALTYVCTATNEAGEAKTSAPLKVTPAVLNDQPEDRPMFLHPLRDVITDEGQPLVLEAPFSGNPIPSVQWSKDAQPIQASDRILLTCDGKKVGLCIDRSLPSDAGIYGVVITNPLGSESSQAKASVHKVFQGPSFTQRFGDLQQVPNRDAKFPARVSGVPQPEISWSKDGQPLRETDKYHIKREGDMCCLYVLNCQPEDEGTYTCTAANKEGQDTCVGRLEVVKEIKHQKKIEPANFVKKIGDTELYKGMTAKFTACVAGTPDPTVEWYRNDQRLYPSDRIRMETDRNGLLRLTISGIDQDDLGKYVCKIHNEHGADACEAYMRFDEGLETKKRPITDQYTEYDRYKKSGAPIPLADAPIISRMTDRRCTISWKPSIPSGPRAPVTYQLEMLELPEGDWFTVRTGIRSCVCDVHNLEPFRDYKFRIRVENKYGISDPSPYAVTHREKLEPEPPKFMPYLPPGIDFRPETSPYFPTGFDIERPPHDNMAQAPRFLRQEHDTQYGVKDHNNNLFWFVYGYPKPKMSFYFNDDLIEPGGRFDMSYTRNGQATLFINKMLDRDVGWYEAVATNEHGEARQRVRLEVAEAPIFIRRPDIEYVMVRGQARFEARILGVPYPEVKWYKDWKPLANSSRTKIQFIEPDTQILVINDAIFKDEGLYSVSARNVAGSISASAMLHLEENDLEYNIRTYNNPAAIKIKKKPYTDYYDIGDELGRGTQGVTYHAVERLNGRNFAAKIMNGRGDFRPMMYNEWEMMNQLHHKRLISLHDAYEHEDYLTLITELAAGGELVKDYLIRQDYYTESEISGYIRQLLHGIKYMHERGFGHMGLNIGDLLLSHPGSDELKICDFGLTRQIQMGRLYPLKYGVPEYVSPECANGEGTGLGHDMWSIGIITYILLSGRSPFRGQHDMETLQRIQAGKWAFEESWWSNFSIEARDFITKLLVYQADGRMDVHTALRHPWLERADKMYLDEFRISSKYLKDYYVLYREWYDNASCRRWFRRRPLEGAFTHPSKMVYPPGDRETPPPEPDRAPKKARTWEEAIPARSPLNYEIGPFKSESHYQNGPDTYLLQLRDVDFPVRLREYMKVAGSRGIAHAHILSNENGFDWETPVIRERRRFTDIMDEEIDDERKNRINRYGSADTGYTIRRLRHEIGARLDTYAEAEAFLESKMVGRLPFFREKPQMLAMREGFDLELMCMAVGDPEPVVQWFKNDGIVAESHRIKIETDKDGRSHYKLSPALGFDCGMYKIVARNKIGQTVARTRIVYGTTSDAPDSPEASQVSDNEVLLTWKQPKHDGHSPVICYSLQYKLADDMEWNDRANNIDHEFYLMKDLEPGKNYIFRLAAKNSIGWSDFGVASPVIMTQPTGATKIQLSRAMQHLQQITDSGAEVVPDVGHTLNYDVENKPIEWVDKDPKEKYNFISEIARGRYSTIVKALDKIKDTVVVAKIIDTALQGADHVEGEFAALRSLRHERIAGLLGAYKVPDGTTAFILEKLQGSDVLTYLSSRHEYSEQTVATIVTQVLDGLQYLHWRGLCHLDLQPENIVMCGVRSVQVKLVDLGCAHRVTKLGNRVPVVGHQDYIAPEVLNEEPAYPQTDIWSVGVLTYLLLSGTLPFLGVDDNETRQNILFVRFRFEHLYKEISQEAVRFVMLLFKRHPNKRPTAEECHENRWLLPTDSMIKKRERAVFLGNRLKDYSDLYHAEKSNELTNLGGKMARSHSIQEELLTAPF